jgi:hypothetical protein
MNKTKNLAILLAATFLYAVYLSTSTSGSMHQILKPALAQDISSAIKKAIRFNSKANDKKGVYTWVNKEGTNPVLNFKLNMDNVVQKTIQLIQNISWS